MALTETAKAKLLDEVKLKFGRDFPSELIDIYVQAFIDNNQDANEAILVMRQSDTYKSYFPGNVNPDGVSVKYTEQEYLNLVDAYKRKIESIGLNADLIITNDRLETLVKNVVSNEEFGARVTAVYQQVLTALPQVKEYYQRNFGKTLTDAEIIASAIDPDISKGLYAGTISAGEVISQNIARAQIGAEALLAGTDIGVQSAEQLRQLGLSREQARRGFQQAEQIMGLAQAQAREGVTAEQIVQATELGIAEQQERIGRIVAQSAAQSAAQLGAARTREGAVSGLVEQ
jgi:hypothetical protein